MHHVLQCGVKGFRNNRLENPLAFHNLRALVGISSQDHGHVSVWMLHYPHPYVFPTFSCKDWKGRGWGKGSKPKEILVSLGQDSFSCHCHVLGTVSMLFRVPCLCLGVLPFIFMQARTVSQELLGLRKAILALSNPVLLSGIQLPGGEDARDSGMLFPACFSLLGMLFAPDTSGNYQRSFMKDRWKHIIRVVKNSYCNPGMECGILCVYLDLSYLFNRTLKTNLTLLGSLNICVVNVCNCIWCIYRM